MSRHSTTKSSRRQTLKRRETLVVGYGYVGRYRDGTLGWCCPAFISEGRHYPGHPERGPHNHGERSYLCRITIEQVFDKRGRPVVRFIGGKKPRPNPEF